MHEDLPDTYLIRIRFLQIYVSGFYICGAK